MARFNAKTTIKSGSITIDLPNWNPIKEIDQNTWEIEIPDDEFDKNINRPSKEKIRRKYRRQPLWDRPDVTDDV